MNSTTNPLTQCMILRPEFARPTTGALTLATRLRLLVTAVVVGFVPLVLTSPTIGTCVSNLGRRVAANRIEASRVGPMRTPVVITLTAENHSISDTANPVMSGWTLPPLPTPASRFTDEPSSLFADRAVVGRITAASTVIDRTNTGRSPNRRTPARPAPAGQRTNGSAFLSPGIAKRRQSASASQSSSASQLQSARLTRSASLVRTSRSEEIEEKTADHAGLPVRETSRSTSAIRRAPGRINAN